MIDPFGGSGGCLVDLIFLDGCGVPRCFWLVLGNYCLTRLGRQTDRQSEGDRERERKKERERERECQTV